MSKGKGFLEEKPGHKSMMRLMSLLSLLAACLISFMLVQADEPSRIEFYLVVAFLVGAFTPKVFQKYAEDAIKAVDKS